MQCLVTIAGMHLFLVITFLNRDPRWRIQVVWEQIAQVVEESANLEAAAGRAGMWDQQTQKS